MFHLAIEPQTRVIQLGHVLDEHSTHNSGVPPFAERLYEKHDLTREIIPGQIAGVTSATDTIHMSTHYGTHMDSLSHIAFQGRFFDGTHFEDDGVQDGSRGVRLMTRENFSPIVSRGVLLDFPKLHDAERVPADYLITLTELHRCCAAQGVEIAGGDTVLLRTGWDTVAHDNAEYNKLPIPGPDIAVARFLVERGAVATGADTMPYEAAPGKEPLDVHVELLAKAGIFIFEMMDLRELAASGSHEFVFVAAPLRLRWGTGSPVNPLAIVPA